LASFAVTLSIEIVLEPIPMPRIHRYAFTVPAEVIDGNGHASNVAYVQWMQDAAIGHCIAQGWPTERYRSIGATWVARSHTIEYLQPARAGEAIEVLTWVADFRKVRSRRRYRFVRKSDGAVLARAETDWIFVNAETGQPRAAPPEVVQSFEVAGDEPEL
jgi:acyl-CoA thioester hydrolase